MDLGSAGFRTFYVQVAVTNSVKSKRTCIGTWLQAWLDPEAEKISPGLGTSIPPLCCPLCWFLPQAGSPGLAAPAPLCSDQ